MHGAVAEEVAGELVEQQDQCQRAAGPPSSTGPARHAAPHRPRRPKRSRISASVAADLVNHSSRGWPNCAESGEPNQKSRTSPGATLTAVLNGRGGSGGRRGRRGPKRGVLSLLRDAFERHLQRRLELAVAAGERVLRRVCSTSMSGSVP